MQDHLAILEKYRRTQTGSGWHTAPDDGYLYDHLAYHLKEAGLIDELKALFFDQNWLHVRAAASDYSHYLADLQIAWDISYQESLRQIEANEEPAALMDCPHYVLIESSLRSWAESRTPSVVARAVETGLWSPERALSLAALIPDEKRRADMYAALPKTGKLTPAQTVEAKTEALEAAKNIEFLGWRASTLSSLSQETEAEQQHETVSAALDASLQEADSVFGGNGYSLYQLIGKLPDDLIERALVGVLALKNPEAKAWALSELAKRLPEERRYEVLRQGLEAAIDIPKPREGDTDVMMSFAAVLRANRSDVSVANALAQLADQLTGDLVIRALDAALALKEGNWRPRAIAGLMDKLDYAQVARVFESMLTITDQWWRADGLMSVVEHSTGETQRRALLALLSTQHGEAREKIRGWLDHFGDIQLVETALELAQQLEDSEHRTQTLNALHDLLDAKRKEAEIVSIADLQTQAEAFLSQAEQLHGQERSQQVLNAYTMIFKIEDEALKNQLMERLQMVAQDDPEESIALDDEALQDVLQIKYEEDRSQALARIARKLPEHLIPPALEAAFQIEETLYRDWAFDGLAKRLTGDMLNSALEGRFDHGDITARIHGLQALAGRIETPTRTLVQAYILDTALNIGNPGWRIEPLQKLLPDLEGDLARKAASALWKTAQGLRRDETTAQAAAIAVEHLEGEERVEALKAALDTVWAYEDRSQLVSEVMKPDESQSNYYKDMENWRRVHAAIPLLKYLEGQEKQVNLIKVVDLVLTISDGLWLQGGVEAIAPYLEGELLKRVLDAVLKITEGQTRAKAIMSLIDNLPDTDIPRVLEIAQAIPEPYWRAKMVIALAKRSDGEQRDTLLGQAYEAALRETDKKWCLPLLVDLAALGLSDALNQGMAMAEGVTDEWERAQALALFLPLLDNQTDVVKRIRRGLLSQLHNLRSQPRAKLFWEFYPETIFKPPIISSSDLTALATDALAICQQWGWV